MALACRSPPRLGASQSHSPRFKCNAQLNATALPSSILHLAILTLTSCRPPLDSPLSSSIQCRPEAAPEARYHKKYTPSKDGRTSNSYSPGGANPSCPSPVLRCPILCHGDRVARDRRQDQLHTCLADFHHWGASKGPGCKDQDLPDLSVESR